MQKLHLNTVGYEILTRMFDVVIGTGEILLNPPRNWRQVKEHLDKPFPSQRLSLEMHRLKKRGLLSQRKRGGNSYLKLTPLGQLALYRYRLAHLLTTKPWNGLWFVVIFDIPEISRKDRNFLRNQLKYIGFAELQKSVWVFPFDVSKELQELLSLYKKHFGRELRFLAVSNIDSDKDLKNHFGL